MAPVPKGLGMKIYVHIGFAKTGTTTIQSFLHENQFALLGGKRSLVLTGLGPNANCSELAIYGFQPSATDYKESRFLQRHKIQSAVDYERACRHVEATLHEAIGKSKPQALIVSSEMLSNHLRTEERVSRLAELLWRYSRDIDIIAYVRRQDQLWVSMYSQYLKAGGSAPFASKPIESLINFKPTLDSWSRVFGRSSMSVGVLERSSLRNGDLIDDFLDRVGLDSEGLSRPLIKNERLAVEAAEFLRQMNETLPRGRSVSPLLVAALESWSSDKEKLALDLNDCWEIIQSVGPSNAAIAREYLDRAGGDLFLDMPQRPAEIAIHPPSKAPASLSASTAVEIASHLLAAQNHTIVQLRGELDRLRARVTRSD